MKRILLLSAFFLFIISYTHAASGDTIRVKSHTDVLIQTNPAVGSTRYPFFAQFPASTVNYRKALLVLSFKCPTGMSCGEWDYINAIHLRRKGGVNGEDKNLELARFITPYGLTFNSSWKFAWHLDISDYAHLLHDSLEIEYYHSGYETNVGRGWIVNLEFILIEGSPFADVVRMDSMWDGTFPYGNAANPIENYFNARTYTMSPETYLARLRLNQTGHGADTFYCSEFCYPTKNIILDNFSMYTRQIFRRCGGNGLFPQGGTWVFDRANWCPGEMVFPEIFDFKVNGNSTHAWDIDMEPYEVRSPSANYYVRSQLIQFKKPRAADDVALDDVLAPNGPSSVYNRMNPVCSNPKVVIKNMGYKDLTACVIKYGIIGEPMFTHYWNGNLKTGETAEVQLNNILKPSSSNNTFMAIASYPNGYQDEYPMDDTARTIANLPPVNNTPIILTFRTNNAPNENSYTVKDDAGYIVASRDSGTLIANRQYRDTLNLPAGCYTIEFVDRGGDGLSFFANPAQGNGAISLLRNNGSLLKSFAADFGNFVWYQYQVGDPAYRAESGLQENQDQGDWLEVYPNPSDINLHISCFVTPKNTPAQIQLTDLNGKLIYSKTIDKPGFHEVQWNTTSLLPGMYFVNFSNAGTHKTEKVLVY